MTAPPEISRRVWGVVLLLLLGSFILVLWNRFRSSPELVVVRREPVAVMGTSCQIVAVIPSEHASRAKLILDAAERELRRSEALFSTWMDASEMSRFNAAPAGTPVELSDAVVDMLARARELYSDTNGAFDVTAAPLVEIWRRAAERGRRPSPHELNVARSSSSWGDFELLTAPASGIRKRKTALLDVDGIAKGYAIDLAIEALLKAGATGGMVEVGGDLRVVGTPPGGSVWRIDIRSPFANESLGVIEVGSGAVCTSGGYARPVDIDGETFSHIIDPRSGTPVDGAVSVTVVADDATTADAWATALSVLGTSASDLIAVQQRLEALLIFGPAEAPSAVATQGFPEVSASRDLAVRPLP